MRRTIVLHHHIFKNAGSSVDQVLEANFGEAWLRREYVPGIDDSGLQAEQWIRETSSGAAYSSHTWRGKLPRPAEVDVVSLVMLRDPISRVRSAYEFERRQDRDAPGPNIAKAHDFADYVKLRLQRPDDRQCRNLQTYTLSVLSPGPEPELERACRALDQFSVVGFVETFDESMERLSEAVRPYYPDFKAIRAWTNRRINDHPDVSPELQALLEDNHRDDMALLAYARDCQQLRTR